MSKSNASANIAFQPGQKLVFKPTTKNRGFRATAGVEVTVGPKGIYFDGADRRYVDIVWPAGCGQVNGGYYTHDFEALPVAPKEPTAPMTKAVLDLLRRKGAITQMEAQGVLRCRALPRRIADLKALGHNIVRELKVDPTGQRYARYHLAYAA
ncbi:helix-turn-helix domain-containing protein [Ensifer aridi]|uniref:helix-turn-helix domain-containing protein n=1 Tax=Ensifer aridi TaxID=1708715 RepID=UPI000A11F33F|nr:helix-turn-helix domain-containing protein [Ensifer aridi]